MVSVHKFSLSIFRRAKYWLLSALLACVLLPVIGLLIAPALLCVTDAPRKADVVILLGGDDGSRIDRVVQLFKSGLATNVIISGDIPSRSEWLINAGVPKEAILVDSEAQNTSENAQFSINIMKSHGFKSALIVTSWYHTRRARNCFNHYGPGLAFYAQPTHQSAEVAKNWGSPAPSILKEYPKAIWYWFRFGVSPF
jgi:uncharacterized SAM-binding protein YcdF (DUF218 family)